MRALTALADPTRQRIVELLAEGERSAGQIAAEIHRRRGSATKRR